MAGKSHVDDSVIERRLRPIYDWLDNGNNKKAVQEADKVLRKQPNLHCASVLKALALLRLGRNKESTEIVNNVVSEGTSDDATLQALTICYREMHQPHLICSIYENALKLDPTNEDIISHLFMAYVRVGNYKKQQVTAMMLYKLKPKNPYYFWAIMSIVMQAHTTKDSVSRKVSLQLAERMILKFVNEDKIDSEAEVLTYLYILELEEKYEDALAVLDGPLARRIVQKMQNFMPLKRALYNTKLNKFDSASIIYMDLILEQPDNWQHYVFFVDTILSMYKRHVNAPEGKADPLQEASQFLTNAREKNISLGGENRSPFLGLLQFALKLKEEGLHEKIELVCGNVTDLLFDYIKHIGSKMCCYTDIVNFLPLVPKEETSTLLERVFNLVEKDANGVPVSINHIFMHQIGLQLQRAFGKEDFTETAEDIVKFADRLVHFYQETSQFCAHMATTDIKPNDTYLILASHYYFEALSHLVTKISSSSNEEQKEFSSFASNTLVKLCCLLEHGIEICKANYHLKLLLIKAYNLIGATSASYDVYERLDMKQIQVDTLGHIMSLQSLDTGHYSCASTIFSTTLKFFMANYKDTSDPLIMAYKFGSLCRIPECVEFRERLNNSLHFATVTAEQMILELTSKGNSKAELEELMEQLDVDPANEKTVWDDLWDNRDLDVMVSWKPGDKKIIEELKKETFSDDVTLLNSMVNGTVNGACEDETSLPATVMKDLIDSLSLQIQDCDSTKKRTREISQIPIQGPDLARIHLYAKGNHHKCILKHAEAVLRIYNCTVGSEGLDAWSSDVIKGLNEVFDQELSFVLPHLDTLQVLPSSALPWLNTQPLGHISHFLQTVSLILILF
ncbi:N-alpha-acetyltransferase 25, NatB auxiliary subunit [Armadillidium nasatum]|uniref:N-terminal acetyltransferase B complex subunit MDM20 homolog n=1 Tax=Armadillidium nasatum TaxID=96803 RepID=A0A5N5SLM3_9CRUS|nr:N-alpha-acetyltransferase 25, NatB auxiliary subunit [Armadillidium nasatum]